MSTSGEDSRVSDVLRVLPSEAPANVGEELETMGGEITIAIPVGQLPGSQEESQDGPQSVSPSLSRSGQPGYGGRSMDQLVTAPLATLDLDGSNFRTPKPMQKQTCEDKEKSETLGIRTLPLAAAFYDRKEKLNERLEEQEKRSCKMVINILTNDLIVERNNNQELREENKQLKRQWMVVVEENGKLAQVIAKLKEVEEKYLKGSIDGIVDFKNRRPIGDGSEGTTLYRAKCYVLEKDVAVKEMLKTKVSDKYFRERERRHFLEANNCPYIVRLLDYVETDPRFWYLCIELCQASLYEYVERDKKITFLQELGRRSEFERRHLNIRLLDQCMEGVQYLHSKKIVHRDLKPHNILLCWNQELKGDECIERLTAKISDLGLSKKFVEAGKSVSVSKGLRGTLGWAAPEMKKGTIIEAADVFTMGCVTQFVLFGLHPFGIEEHRSRNIDVYEHVNLRRADFMTSKLIKEMISKTPNYRPTCAEVRSHCLFWNERKQITFFNAVNNWFPKKRGEKIQDSRKLRALLLLDYKLDEFKRRFPGDIIPCSSPLCIYENGNGSNTALCNWKLCVEFFLPVEKNDAKFDDKDGTSARQLIRYMRNKMAHCSDDTARAIKLMDDLKAKKEKAVENKPPSYQATKEILDENPGQDEPTHTPDGPYDIIVLRYVLAWFPNLLVHTYNVVEYFLKKEREFKEFFVCPTIPYN